MNSKPKVPEDLGVKIGSKEQALWADVVSQTKAGLAAIERNLTVNKAMLEMAEKKEAEEKAKFESKS